MKSIICKIVKMHKMYIYTGHGYTEWYFEWCICIFAWTFCIIPIYIGIFNTVTYYITTNCLVLCDSTETLNIYTQQDAKHKYVFHMPLFSKLI
jgi:hypothetical protein